MDAQLAAAYAFLDAHTLGVLSTIGADGAPNASTIEYGQTPECELIFGTFMSYRKYANLLRDPRMAFVVTSGRKTLQWQGTARLLAGDERERYTKHFFAKMPRAEKFSQREGIAYFLAKPTWIRYADYEADPHQGWELLL